MNKQKGKVEGTTLPYSRIPINKYRRKEGNRESLHKHHSNNCCRLDPLMNPKIRGQKLEGNQLA